MLRKNIYIPEDLEPKWNKIDNKSGFVQEALRIQQPLLDEALSRIASRLSDNEIKLIIDVLNSTSYNKMLIKNLSLEIKDSAQYSDIGSKFDMDIDNLVNKIKSSETIEKWALIREINIFTNNNKDNGSLDDLIDYLRK